MMFAQAQFTEMDESIDDNPKTQHWCKERINTKLLSLSITFIFPFLIATICTVMAIYNSFDTSKYESSTQTTCAITSINNLQCNNTSQHIYSYKFETIEGNCQNTITENASDCTTNEPIFNKGDFTTCFITTTCDGTILNNYKKDYIIFILCVVLSVIFWIVTIWRGIIAIVYCCQHRNKPRKQSEISFVEQNNKVLKNNEIM
eukprot:169763_1